jgi:glycosyltransferase involved in cell wall biosynthesis
MKIAVVVLTWKRISKIQETLRSFARQQYKDFTLIISNGNLDPRAVRVLERWANMYKDSHLKIVVRHDGNEQYAFRRFYVGKDLCDEGYDVVMFVDDDVSIPIDYIGNCIKQYRPKTYQSGFTWIFYENGKDYYKFRKRVYTNDYGVHYAGTGFSMVDATLFKDPDLISKAIPGSDKIEDLWLSYFVYHKEGWEIRHMDVPGVILGGSDSVALFKQVRHDTINKKDMMLHLVKKGWKIPKDLPTELA